MRIIRTMNVHEYELHRRKFRHSITMKRLLLVATTILLLGILSASASPAVGGRVKVRQQNFALVGDSVVVEIEVDMRDVHVDPRSSVLLTPVLRSGSASLELPAIRINGDNQHKAYRRLQSLHKKDPATGMELHANSRKNPGPHLYRTSIPYEPWMDGASFLLREDQCECSGPLMSLSMELMASSLTGRKSHVATPYQPRLSVSYVVPEAEAVKRRSEAGKAYLDFAVGKAEIVASFKNNASELQRIHDLVAQVKNDPDAKITGITIEGYASPEGSYASNLALSERRAQALKSHLQSMYGFSASLFAVSGKGEDWNTLDTLVSRSVLTEKYRILEIIRGTDVFDGRERKLMDLSGGKPYHQMKTDFFPQLRRSDYILDYTVLPFTIDKGKEVFKTKPGSLSLNEMFLIAGTYEPGSDAFNEVFTTAARVFPDNDTANLNAAANALEQKDVQSAARYLDKVKQHTAAWYNCMGVLYAEREQWAEASAAFKQAAEAGDKQAAANLREVSLRLGN